MQSTPKKRTRRKHAPDLMRQVILACQQPGASVAAVALAHAESGSGDHARAFLGEWRADSFTDGLAPLGLVESGGSGLASGQVWAARFGNCTDSVVFMDPNHVHLCG
jgi:hypothetical protein